jgi:hypothetical protein
MGRALTWRTPPNSQTEVQKSPLGFIYAPEAMRRTLAFGDKLGQLSPKLRPDVASFVTQKEAAWSP